MGSGSNQDIVRSIYAAVGEGRMPFELLDPQIELDMSERIFNPAVYRGHEGARQFYGEIAEIWDSWLSEPEQMFESGEQVVVFVRSRGRGKSSGVEVEDTIGERVDDPRRQGRRLPSLPGPGRGARGGRPAAKRRLSARAYSAGVSGPCGATVPPSGSSGKPASSQACRPPERL